MKKGIQSYAICIVLGVVLPLGNLFSQNQRSSTVVSLAELKNQLTSLQGQISGTVAALERVKSSAEDDSALGKASSDFNSRLKGLDAQVELIRKYAVTVKARAKDHYEAWQKEISTVQNPKIREKAQERFAEARKQFDKIISSADEAKQHVTPFVADLKDIGTYLEVDTSQDAVKSLSGTIWKLGNKTKSVLGSISDVNEQIDRTIQAMPKA